jgi:hypothetical protein
MAEKLWTELASKESGPEPATAVKARIRQGEPPARTRRTREPRWARALVIAASMCVVCLLWSPAVVITRSQRAVTEVLFGNIWPPGSPAACLVAQLQQGLSYHEARDTCESDLMGAKVGATLPEGGAASPVLVPKGSRTPGTSACVSVVWIWTTSRRCRHRP